jgi:hypothetical protein
MDVPAHRPCRWVRGKALSGPVWFGQEWRGLVRWGSSTEGFLVFPSLLDPFVGSDADRQASAWRGLDR